MHFKSTLKLLILLFILLSHKPLKAQFFVTGDNPASTKWSKIKSKNYTIIFPREIDSLGLRYLWLLESNRSKILKGLEINPKRFPVILNPYTVNSNGMVTWVPKRMELYTQPPANGYAQNWEEQLVLHETRHVGQIYHFSKGVFSVLDKVLGEMINGLGVGIYASSWFLEGDAVVSETQFSNSGRGRDASFLEYYRVAGLSNHKRDWNQWRYGSYKYYTPGSYEFGYIMQSTIRYRTDMYNYPGKILDRIVRRFYNPWANSQFDQKHTGYSTQDNLQVGLSFMKTLWEEDLKQRGNFSKTAILQHKPSANGYNSNYKNSLALSADSVLYMKNSFNNPSNLVLLSSDTTFRKKHKKGEKHLRPFSFAIDNLTYAPKLNRIYFNEAIPHPRWQLKSYNKVYYYDVKTNKIKKISKKSSYNNPSINKSETQIAVSEYNIKGGSSLVILNSETGEKIKTIPAPYNGQLCETQWIDDVIYATIITDKGMGLFKIDTKKDANWETVINEQFAALQSLKYNDKKLYFTSGIDGVSNIYALSVPENKIERVTNSKFGLNGYSIKENNLFASQASLSGREPVFMQMGAQDGLKIELKEKNLTADYKYIIADKLSEQAHKVIESDSLLNAGFKISEAEFNKEAKIKPYRKIGNLLHIHSWAPIFINPSILKQKNFDNPYEVVGLGATIFSQNLLGTAVTMLGYSYKKGFHAGHLNFTYSGWYPVIEIEANINEEQRYGYKLIGTDASHLQFIRYDLNSPLIETTARAYIPFNFSSHGWKRSFTPQIEWQFNNNTIYSYKENKSIFRNQINGGIQYSQMRPIAKAAIFPKWGAGVVVKGGFSPLNTELFGQISAIHTFGYFPGILPRHGLKITAGYQKQFNKNKLFYLDNILTMPRGFSDDYYASDYTKLTLDYAIPIYLQDFSIISGLVYFQRLRVTPYVDYAFTNKGNLYTYGGEVAFDAYFLRIGVPVTLGLRYGRNGATENFGFKKNVVQMVFNVSL